MKILWTHDEAVELCVIIESIVPAYGCHVALTGGTLYKTGKRKDCDILFYRIRQQKCIDMVGMWDALAKKADFTKLSGFGWCYKAQYEGKSVDCFFPEGERDEDGNEIEYGIVEVVPSVAGTGVNEFSDLVAEGAYDDITFGMRF